MFYRVKTTTGKYLYINSVGSYSLIYWKEKAIKFKSIYEADKLKYLAGKNALILDENNKKVSLVPLKLNQDIEYSEITI